MPSRYAILTLLAILSCGVARAATNIDPAWLDNPANQGIVNGRTVYILKKAGETYSLQVDVAAKGTAFYIANRDITFDLNGHTVTYNSDNFPGPGGEQDHRLGAHGVVLYTNWHNAEIVIAGAATPSRATIKNGSIVNANAGNLSHGIFGFESNGSVIEGLSVLTNGKDSYAIAFSWASGGTPTINNNVLETRTSTTFNRHSGPACVEMFLDCGAGASVAFDASCWSTSRWKPGDDLSRFYAKLRKGGTRVYVEPRLTKEQVAAGLGQLVDGTIAAEDFDTGPFFKPDLAIQPGETIRGPLVGSTKPPAGVTPMLRDPKDLNWTRPK